MVSATTKERAERRRKEREAEEAMAAATLQREKEQAARAEREEEKKRRAMERSQEEEAEKERKRQEAVARAEEAKRAFDEAKKLAIAESMARRQKGTEQSAGVVSPPEAQENINVLLTELNANSEASIQPDEEAAEEAKDEDVLMGEVGDEVQVTTTRDEAQVTANRGGDSPIKKKSKSEKKAEKAERRAQRKQEKAEARKKALDEANQANKAREGQASALKQGKYSSAGSVKLSATARTQRKQHKHTYQRQIVDTSIVLDASGGKAAKMQQFIIAIKQLLENMLLLDPWAQIDPREKDSGIDPFFGAEDVPSNHSKLSFHIKSSGGGEAFAMQKPRKNDTKGQRRNAQREESDEDGELVDPRVFFNFAMSSDMEPGDLMERVSCEWGKIGGQQMYMKEFDSFETELAVMALTMWNRLSPRTFLAEFQAMFTEAKEVLREQAEDNMECWKGYDLPIPKFGTRFMNPKINGQDTSVFSGWNNSKLARRKAVHIEVEAASAPHVHEVVSVMKSAGILRKYWGKNAHLSNILRDSKGRIQMSPSELSNLAVMARDHVNFQASMITTGLSGVVSLDKEVPFPDAVDPSKTAGRVSLRHILYNYVKLVDGHTLFVEIHQGSPVEEVEVIVPNTPVALSMMEQINKNLPAWLMGYLVEEVKIPKSFVTALVKAATDPLQCREIPQCKFDPKTWALQTPQDERKKKEQALQSAAWYKDEFGDHMADKSRKEAPAEFANEEFMYDADGNKSVTTIHQKKGKGGSKTYKGSPGAPSFSLGRPEVVNAEAEDEMSGISDATKGKAPEDRDIDAMSRAELVEMCKTLSLQKKAKKKGSPPDSASAKSADGASRGGEEAYSVSSDSSSSNDSSSDEDEDQAADAPPTPSAGGSDVPPQPALGE